MISAFLFFLCSSLGCVYSAAVSARVSLSHWVVETARNDHATVLHPRMVMRSWIGHETPCVAYASSPGSLHVHAEISGNVREFIARNVANPYLTDGVFCEFDLTMSFTNGDAVASLCVVHVVLLRSDQEVIRAATRGVVTGMTHINARFKRAVCQRERYAMTVEVSISEVKHPVPSTLFNPVSGPEPARGRILDFLYKGPESHYVGFREVRSMNGFSGKVHVSEHTADPRSSQHEKEERCFTS